MLGYRKRAHSSPAAIVVPVTILSNKSHDLLLGHRSEDAASFWAAVDALCWGRLAAPHRGPIGQGGGSECPGPRGVAASGAHSGFGL